MKKFYQKFKSTILYLIKGIGIGVAMIVPGVSGGTLAVLFNIYNDIIDSINNLFTHFKKSFKILFPILIGAAIGFIALVKPIKLGLLYCPLIIVSLFVGFIIGGIPQLYEKIKGKSSVIGYVVAFISFEFMIGVCFLVSNFSSMIDLSNITIGLWFYLFLAGIIIAISLVIPGVSGSMMLMVLGLYTSIIGIIDTLFKNFGHNLLILLPLALGAILGFFIISFIMGKLLKKHESTTYFGIIGFVIGSIVTIYFITFIKTIPENINHFAESSSNYNFSFYTSTLQIFLSVICFIIGIVSVVLLNKLLIKKKNSNIESGKSDENEIR